MRTVNIDLLKSEAQRLLRLNVEGLEQMMLVEGLIPDVDVTEETQPTFTQASTPAYIENLKNELDKLENMDLVIAVVGTMKAGKSTTINAIVGTEVLPNRNSPMTALPTRIRHTQGQIDPVLRFENNKPINDLLSQISNLSQMGHADRISEILGKNIEMQALYQSLKKIEGFDRQYVGVDAIYKCLKVLNDLVRFTTLLESGFKGKSSIEFPFGSYRKIEKIPLIEVEFSHLRNTEDSKGRLTLLDTPGPNEAGQEHLRTMLKDQLKKASAVLAVLDYTQLQSGADEEVRAEIEEIAMQQQGRLFALVNRFDQKDSKGDGEAVVKSRVADELMHSFLSEKDVYPVSAKLAYLSSRAKHEIANDNSLSTNDSGWVDDFALKAFGDSWDKDDPDDREELEDIDEVLKKAKKLWKKSRFQDPIDNIINEAHSNVALLSIGSAVDKLIKCGSDIENFLGVRKGALNVSNETLKNLVDSISDDVKNINGFESSTQEYIDLTFDMLKDDIKSTVSESKKNITKELDSYFTKGKIEAAKDEKKLSKKERNKQRGIIAKYEQDFDPEEGEITFGKKEKANNLLNSIKVSVEKVTNFQYEQLSCSTEATLVKFDDDFKSTLDGINEVIDSFNSEMVVDNFEVKIVLPSINSLKMTLTNNRFSSNENISHKKVPRSKYVKQKGFWGGFKRIFNNKWGSDKEYYEIDSYIVDIGDVREYTNNYINGVFDEFSDSLDSEITIPLQSQVDVFFRELSTTFSNIRGDLEQGIQDQKKNQAELDTLKLHLEHFAKAIPTVTIDTQALHNDIKQLHLVSAGML